MSNKPQSIIQTKNLSKEYSVNSTMGIKSLIGSSDKLKAVDDVSLSIEPGEIVGLAGQSGCGKSTLGELLVYLEKPSSGDIIHNGNNIRNHSKSGRKNFRKDCQVVFQDPYDAMNPRFTVESLLTEPLKIHDIGDRESRNGKIHNILEKVGLNPPGKFLDKKPDELSGGERQRVCIARALVLDPEFIVADEPVSMLDVSVRSGILKLFEEIKKEGISILYISHDLSTINMISDRTMVMYMGKIVERGETNKVIHNHKHPYTESLLASVPESSVFDDEIEKLDKEVPDPINIPRGCRFKSQCDYSIDECNRKEPPLTEFSDENHDASCFNPIGLED